MVNMDTLWRRRQKISQESQKVLAEPQMPLNRQMNALCRKVRLLEGELRAQRQDLSILKRDVSRVDRKVYREGAAGINSKEAEKMMKDIFVMYGPGASNGELAINEEKETIQCQSH